MGSLLNSTRRDPVPQAGTVLVVDDEAVVRNCVAEIFGVMGFEVIQACDGLEALEVYQAQRGVITLVFMDITMPRMDGITSTQKIRAINPSAKVILSSGGFAEHLLSDAKPDAFLPKPYSHATFCDVVRRVIQTGLSPDSPLPLPGLV
jgi:CheY-like chemotaxis protein